MLMLRFHTVCKRLARAVLRICTPLNPKPLTPKALKPCLSVDAEVHTSSRPSTPDGGWGGGGGWKNEVGYHAPSPKPLTSREGSGFRVNALPLRPFSTPT